MLRSQVFKIGTEITALRFFFDNLAGAFARYDVSCIVEHERDQNAAWVWLMKGKLNRALLLDLLAWMEGEGVETIKTVRAEGHRIPGGVTIDGITYVSVSRMRARFPMLDTTMAPLM